MEAEYKRDLHHNYMVIKETEGGSRESCCMKMLGFISLDGVLAVEKRTIDNQVFYYYDISSKQSIKTLPDKSVWTFSQIKQLFTRIILILERAYEYLLAEDDFILDPEFVYLDVATQLPFLCYLAGYQKSIKEQIAGFIEYMMNKADYTDKEAVLLIYSLYAASKEEGATFGLLLNTLNNQNFAVRMKDISTETALSGIMPEGIRGSSDRISSEVQDNKYLEKNGGRPKPPFNRKIPVMKEKVVDEKEIACLPVKTYLYTAACAAGSIMLLFLSIRTGIIYNSFGSRIDYSKLFILLLVMVCINAFLLKKIWGKRNRITKIVTRKEYIDPGNSLTEASKPVFQPKHEQPEKTAVKSPVAFDGSNKDRSALNKPKGHFLKNLDNSIRELQKRTERNQAEVKNKEEENEEEYNNSGTGAGFGPVYNAVSNRYCEPDRKAVSEDNMTCVLNDVPMISYVLKPLDSARYEMIHVTQFPFFIGKLRKNTDYCLEHNAVSRYHAKLTMEQGSYYITDLNSTNGTFHNNEVLSSYEKREIKPGDEIAFANIRFLFLVIRE